MDTHASLQTMTTSQISRSSLSEFMVGPIRRLLVQTLDDTASTLNPDAFHRLTHSDWTALTEEAIRLRLSHGLRQFLLRNPQIRTLAPESALTRLERVRHAILRHNLNQAAQLLRLKRVLDNEGIDCLLMKGLWINAVLYRDQAARRSGDIDLLFKPEDMPRATRVFRQLELGHLDDAVEDVRELAPNNHEFTLKHAASRVSFDIHWAMTHPLHEKPVDEASFWDRSSIYAIAGMNCRSFKLEDHLLLLSHHAAEHHRFQGVGPRALMDLSQVLVWPPGTVDWDDLLRRARLIGWDKGLSLMLALVNDVTGLGPPEALSRQLAAWHSVDPEIRQVAFEAMIQEQDRADTIGNRVLNMTLKTSFAGRLKHILERLFPTPGRMLEYARMSPAQVGRRPWQWPTLYLERWKNLLFDLPKLLELLRGDPVRRAELKRSARLQQWLRGDD
jgi:hypothetical protein